MSGLWRKGLQFRTIRHRQVCNVSMDRTQLAYFHNEIVMKRRLIVYFTALVLLLPAIASAQDIIIWKPVCRHNALYWAIMVGEQFPTRIQYGWFVDKIGIKYYHVQPQLYMGDKWWYFKVKDNHVVLITKPTYTIELSSGEKEKTIWIPQFHWPSLAAYLEYIKNLHVEKPK